MITPELKSLYKFKILSGKHPVFDVIGTLTARAGEETYIDSLLKKLPNCAAGFEIKDNDNITLSLYFFPDNPHCDPDEVIGAYCNYQGGENIFLNQKVVKDDGNNICFFNKEGFFTLCETDCKTVFTPSDVDMQEVQSQLVALEDTYSEVQTCRSAVSMIWNFGELLTED